MRLRLPSLLVCAMLVFQGHQAIASSLSADRFDVTIRDQDVREVLEELSVVLGIPIAVSDAVQGSVSASFDEATAEELLDDISRRRGLDWRYDGHRIEVTAKSEQVTRILDLGGVRVDELNDALGTLGVYQNRFPLRAMDGEIGMIVAPPQYVAMVEIVLARLVHRRKSAIAAAEAEAARVNQAAIRAEDARREHERLQRAHQFALEQERLRKLQNIRTEPVIVRNGIWGG